MGDIKKQKKKYETPSHPWQKTRIETEKVLKEEFGLHNKMESWRVDSLLTSFKDRVKALTVQEGRQADLEREQLAKRLISLSLIKQGDHLDTVLALEARVLMERRLQTIVLRKGLARSIKQARQFITHRHISIGDRLVTVPGYLVTIDEEDRIAFHPGSSLYDVEHPERIQVQKQPEKATEKKKKAVITEEEKKVLTEEEIEAKEIESVLGSEEEQTIGKIAEETPEQEVKEIIADGKTEIGKLEKKK